MNQVKTDIQKIAGTYGMDFVELITCTVNGVANATTRACTVTPVDGSLPPFTAYLMPEIDDGILILPSAGSTVKVLCSTQNAPMVIHYSAIDSIYYVAGGSTIQADANGIQLMGSNYGGMVKLVDPNNSEAGVLARLNKIESDINDLKKALLQYLNPATNPVAEGSPGDPSLFQANLFANLATYFNQDLVQTQRSDLENTVVVHGNGQ